MTKLSLCVALALSGSLQAEENATRGEIRDRHGSVLATSDADGNQAYPFGAVAAHTLGYTGRSRPDRDGITFPRIGRSGVEKQLEAKLAKGEHVQLTLDMRLQLIAEHALRRVGAGCAVVTDPDTGEILALASVPSFDPNDFTTALTKKKFNAYLNNPAQPLFHRARGQFPPGSIFKVITALTIPAGENPHHTCKAKLQIDGRNFHCWNRQGHGELDLKGALKHSCNPYFYQLAQQRGPDEIRRVAALLGFGARVGLPIEGEPTGFLPNRESVKQKYGIDWAAGDTANLSIGQGHLSATPQQLAGAIGAIANDGTYIRPHLLAGQQPKKIDLRGHGIAPETLATVKAALFEVVNAADGTGRRTRIDGKKIYGKTGTAMWKPGKYLAWFSGWTDTRTGGEKGETRRLAITVLVENGQSAGKVAAPLARMILADCLTLPPRAAGEKLVPERLAPAVGHTDTIEVLDEK